MNEDIKRQYESLAGELGWLERCLQYTKVEGSLPSQGRNKNQPMNT